MRKTFLVMIIGVALLGYGAYMPAKALLAQHLIQQAWESSKKSGEAISPWGWADMHPVMKLSSSKHEQSLIVLSGDTGNVLAFGPGHNLQSGQVGEYKTVMISAHRDTHFRFLELVELGDQFTLEGTSQNKRYKYEVVDVTIIDSDKQEIEINYKDELKLVTCYPFNQANYGSSLRMVVSLAPQKIDKRAVKQLKF